MQPSYTITELLSQRIEIFFIPRTPRTEPALTESRDEFSFSSDFRKRGSLCAPANRNARQ